MDENALGRLLRIAKGNDRSIREYSRDSGVDAAVISKMINGNYIPKKTAVYKALTSEKAAPRGGVTYLQLLNALSERNESNSFQKGVDEGIKNMIEKLVKSEAINPSVLSAFVTGKKNVDTLREKEILSEIQKFSVMSNGLILLSLGSMGFRFQVSPDRYESLVNKFDTYLRIDNADIKEYLIRYAYIPKEQQGERFFVENTPKRMIQELVFIPSADTRKVSIVTNLKSSYDFLISYKGKLSYCGELSVVLVDMNKMEICKEEYISHYVGGKSSKEFYLVDKKKN